MVKTTVYDDIDNIDDFPCLVYDCHGNIFIVNTDTAKSYFNLYCVAPNAVQGWGVQSEDTKYNIGSQIGTVNLADYKKFHGTLALKN